MRPALKGHTIIIVDDGTATGATIRAAIARLRQSGVVQLIVAVPVAPRDTAVALQSEVDTFVCLFVPDFFDAIGSFYEDFSKTPDEAVIALLDKAAERDAADSPRIVQAE